MILHTVADSICIESLSLAINNGRTMVAREFQDSVTGYRHTALVFEENFL